ncbi:MAG TPA: DUF1934 family protein [Bacilli bacterium]|jgi:uncharacterized beta-barrel protein YwiB (DUF1934 family)|nr:DUF1934 family protein [Acholeplasmataceae bacterium]OQB60672.1 MAG: hypothetical protein BWX94_01489 [Tenericutes bacterium ADurb.Bin140]HOE78017.1 DUF1934 family protein [Bacilli bacterium]HON64661.1 DUF1934 family protein [Bacilli bacterium]HOR96089.1 DUF1934 family protein [Bacilli bacterium]
MKVQVDFSLMATDGTSIRFLTDGELTVEDNIRRLKFIEQTDAKLLTAIDIYTNKVKILRTGLIMMDMELNPQHETTLKMNTKEKFEMSMRCITDHLVIDDDYFEAIYQTEMDKEQGVYHQLKVTFKQDNTN